MVFVYASLLPVKETKVSVAETVLAPVGEEVRNVAFTFGSRQPPARVQQPKSSSPLSSVRLILDVP
jgi:hypothetical protein